MCFIFPNHRSESWQKLCLGSGAPEGMGRPWLWRLCCLQQMDRWSAAAAAPLTSKHLGQFITGLSPAPLVQTWKVKAVNSLLPPRPGEHWSLLNPLCLDVTSFEICSVGLVWEQDNCCEGLGLESRHFYSQRAIVCLPRWTGVKHYSIIFS